MRVAMVRPAFQRPRPTSCAAPWRPSSSPAASTSSSDKLIEGMIDNGYDASSPSGRSAARRLRQLRLSGKPRRVLCADRLRLELDEMPSSGRVSAPRSSMRSRWASMRLPSSCATRASMASRCGRSMSTTRDWDCTLEHRDGEPSRRPARPAHDAGPCGEGRPRRSSRSRGARPFQQRRSNLRGGRGLARACLVRLAKADAFASHRALDAGDASWAIKGLRDDSPAAVRRGGTALARRLYPELNERDVSASRP